MTRKLRYAAATFLTGAIIFGVGSLLGSETDVFAAGPASAGSQAGLEIEEVDIANFPTVRVTVGVPGGLESILANGGSFSVAENGKPRPTAATNILGSENLEVILVIDRSGSMVGDAMDATKTAAIGFLTAMPPEVSIGLVTFGSDVTLDVESTGDRDRLAAAISAITAEGRTALNNAIVFASTLFAPATERRVLVLLSDGGDTASSATLAEAVAATSGIRIEIIELVTPETNQNALEQLAGPRLVRATPDPAELDELYASVAQSLVGRVEIVYTSEAQIGDTVDLNIRLVGTNQVRDASVTFNAPPLSTRSATSVATLDSAPSLANSSEPANQGFSWILLAAIMTIFGGLVLLMIGIFVSPDRSMRQRL
ncbi:MAG: VWA domain-containing protein, partial [Ilumatobacteraceae bacterium]